MRQIKFRMWDKTNNAFYDDGFSIAMDGTAWYDDSERSHQFGNYYTLQQFTGLLDKNGNEIYEGDIIKPDDQHITCNCTVVWMDMCWKLQCENSTLLYAKFVWAASEVIGNIFENTHLLNQPA